MYANQNLGTVKRFVALDSLRGVCALIVCLYHFATWSPLTENFIADRGHLFVDFFFVLSGFVISSNYQQKLQTKLTIMNFIGLRLGRVYPLHVFMLVLFVGIECVGLHPPIAKLVGRMAFSEGHTLWDLFLNFFLLHSFNLGATLSWNAPSWSISAEFWTYVGFAISVKLFGKRSPYLMVAVVLAAPMFIFSVSTRGLDVTYDYGWIRSAYGFALGALVFYSGIWKDSTYVSERLLRWPLWTSFEIFAIAAICVGLSQFTLTQEIFFLPGLFAIAIVVFSRELGLVSKLLGTRPLSFVGALSYGIYMVHAFVQARMYNGVSVLQKISGVQLTDNRLVHGVQDRVLGTSELTGTIWTVMMIVFVVCFAWLARKFIELPCQNWARERFGAGAGLG